MADRDPIVFDHILPPPAGGAAWLILWPRINTNDEMLEIDDEHPDKLLHRDTTESDVHTATAMSSEQLGKLEIRSSSRPRRDESLRLADSKQRQMLRSRTLSEFEEEMKADAIRPPESLCWRRLDRINTI